MKDACNWDDAHSTSSKVHRLHSLHIFHIKHKGIRFHISEFGPQHHHTHGKSEPSPVKPTKPQTSWIYSSTTWKPSYNKSRGDPQPSRYNGTYNTNSPLNNLSWWDSQKWEFSPKPLSTQGKKLFEGPWPSIWPSKEKAEGMSPAISHKKIAKWTPSTL